jgi:hypothetical protein
MFLERQVEEKFHALPGFVELSYITTDVQSASLSWYQAPIWGL